MSTKPICPCDATSPFRGPLICRASPQITLPRRRLQLLPQRAAHAAGAPPGQTRRGGLADRVEVRSRHRLRSFRYRPRRHDGGVVRLSR